MENLHHDRITRAELWLGTDFLKRAGLADTLDNHLQMVRQLGQDMICLPVTDDHLLIPDPGYRYFKYNDLGRAVRVFGGPVAAVVDGLFQGRVNRLGLMTVLTEWLRDRGEMTKSLETEKQNKLEQISRCLDQGVDTVVIADDLASEQGLLISPGDIDRRFTPFYVQAADLVHSAHARVFLHSCGNIMPMAAVMETWHLDGLASVQHRVNDLCRLQKSLGPDFVIMAGIEAELLETDHPTPGILKEFETLMRSLSSAGSLILCSSCGLYKGKFLDRLPRIYALADGFFMG